MLSCFRSKLKSSVLPWKVCRKRHAWFHQGSSHMHSLRYEQIYVNSFIFFFLCSLLFQIQVAVKCPTLEKFAEKDTQDFMKEAAIMHSLKHKQIYVNSFIKVGFILCLLLFQIQVAVKCLTLEKFAEKGTQDFIKEAAIMHSLKHEHLVKLFGLVLDMDSSLVLVRKLQE